MFGMKDWKDRWDDTIAYLNTNFPADRLGDHIDQLVPENKKKGIAGQLSLGRRDDGKDDPQYAGNTSQRKALRGLLLCQRVYYSELWAKQSEAGPGLHVIPLPGLLQANWKVDSLAHWSIKSEVQILSGIGMFVTVPGATRDDLKNAAFAGAPNGTSLPGNLTLARTDLATVGQGVICYVGVQGWLVKSGLVSMRWFMQNSAPNKQAGCDLLFGAGREVWRGKIGPGDMARLGRIAADIGPGYVVHIWSPDNYNWNGHWVVTNGDGTICGVNNGEFLAGEAERGQAVQKNYTRTSTLMEQFLSYGGEGAHAGRKTAVMAVIDPLQLPNRI